MFLPEDGRVVVDTESENTNVPSVILEWTMSEDNDTSPGDFDTYDGITVRAFHEKAWQYVTVGVRVEVDSEVVAFESVGGYEHGVFPDGEYVDAFATAREDGLHLEAFQRATLTVKNQIDSLSKVVFPND